MLCYFVKYGHCRLSTVTVHTLCTSHRIVEDGMLRDTDNFFKQTKTLKILNRIEKIMAVLLNVTKTTSGLLREERFEKSVVIRIVLLSFPLDSFPPILHLQEYQTGLLAFLGKIKMKKTCSPQSVMICVSNGLFDSTHLLCCSLQRTDFIAPFGGSSVLYCSPSVIQKIMSKEIFDVRERERERVRKA